MQRSQHSKKESTPQAARYVTSQTRALLRQNDVPHDARWISRAQVPATLYIARGMMVVITLEMKDHRSIVDLQSPCWAKRKFQDRGMN